MGSKARICSYITHSFQVKGDGEGGKYNSKRRKQHATKHKVMKERAQAGTGGIVYLGVTDDGMHKPRKSRWGQLVKRLGVTG